MVGDRNRDGLSELPDEVLHQILSLLQTDEIVRTSVLSPRWRLLWTTNPVLHFTTKSFSNHSISFKNYVSITDHCLRLCTASEKLRSVRFPLINGSSFSSIINRWIRFAADRNIEELILTPACLWGRSWRIKMPVSLFNCRFLTTLKMHSCSIPTVPPGIHGFQSLKTIVFYEVNIGDDSLDGLLSACPCIETLGLSFCDKFKRLMIRAPKLRSLTVNDCYGLNRMEILCAPELRCLMYCGDLSKVGSLEGLLNLEEAALLSWQKCAFKDYHRWRQFISTISHVKILSVNCWLFQFMHGEDPYSANRLPMFENLKELHWSPVFRQSKKAVWYPEWFTRPSLRALISTLKYCPSLEQLCIHRDYFLDIAGEDAEDYRPEDFNNDRSRQRCNINDHLQEFEDVGYVLPELKTIRFVEFLGTNQEARLLKFLLEKAIVLESALLYYGSHTKEYLISRSLPPFRKASPLACLSILEIPLKGVCPKHDDMWYQFMRF